VELPHDIVCYSRKVLAFISSLPSVLYNLLAEIPDGFRFTFQFSNPSKSLTRVPTSEIARLRKLVVEKFRCLDAVPSLLILSNGCIIFWRIALDSDVSRGAVGLVCKGGGAILKKDTSVLLF
jgi:hypothetical protein